MSNDMPVLPESIEALLRGDVPAGVDWEEQARAIERKLTTVSMGSTESHWLDAPLLEAEPGEPAPAPGTATALSKSSSTQLSDLARAVAQKADRKESSALFKESLSVAAAARAQPALSARPRPAPPRVPTQAPTLAAPPAPSPSVATAPPTMRSSLGPFLAGAGVAIAAAAVVAILMRGAAPAPTAPTAIPAQQDSARLEAQRHTPPATPAPMPPSVPESPPAAVAEAPAASAGAHRAEAAPDGPSSSETSPRVASGGRSVPSKLAGGASRKPPPERVVLEESSGSTPSPEPTPELRPASRVSSSVPDRPSPGAVQAALGSVLSAARACVAGTEAPSTATVVFTSAGTVARVTVSGPAAGTPAGGCIQSALGRARVAPFVQATYVVSGIAVRP